MTLSLPAELFGQPGPDGARRPYLATPALRQAARVAWHLGRPLLLTGEPGCGKTDFAWALAQALGQPPLIARVRSQSRAADLLYHFDAVSRFADAQVPGTSPHARDPRRYVELRELGVGLLRGRPAVVLIDEIDKAPRDLPNDLLHVLEEGRFFIPELRRVADTDEVTDQGFPLRYEMRPNTPHRPLVVITSNVERQLPEPFLRRCVFYHIPFPTPEELVRILRGRVALSPEECTTLTGLFLQLRAQPLTKRPSTAELLDWADTLRALDPGWATRPPPPLHQLPALGCLVKLHEDLVRLGAAPAHEGA